jgi:hypothetical protein
VKGLDVSRMKGVDTEQHAGLHAGYRHRQSSCSTEAELMKGIDAERM